MRDVLRQVRVNHSGKGPTHLGLAYNGWAPIADDGSGKVPDSDRSGWLGDLENLAVSEDYPRFFRRWQTSFEGSSGCLAEVVLAGRLLVGHGNGSAADVGITVHHTWGVPVIPGSALKGLVSHYIDIVYGPDEDGLNPDAPDLDETRRDRARYQRATRRGRRIMYGPGDVQRTLFGAPDAPGDGGSGATPASRGAVQFHDALLVVRDGKDCRPFVRDVLTVHQKPYYDHAGRRQGPADFHDPVPVPFLTVRPDTRFLLAVTGPAEAAELALELLLQALEAWGIGGRTSLGYGRAVRRGRIVRIEPSPPPTGVLAEFIGFLDKPPSAPEGGPLSERQLLRIVGREWLPSLKSLSDSERMRALQALKGKLRKSSRRKEAAALFE